MATTMGQGRGHGAEREEDYHVLPIHLNTTSRKSILDGSFLQIGQICIKLKPRPGEVVDAPRVAEIIKKPCQVVARLLCHKVLKSFDLQIDTVEVQFKEDEDGNRMLHQVKGGFVYNIMNHPEEGQDLDLFQFQTEAFSPQGFGSKEIFRIGFMSQNEGVADVGTQMEKVLVGIFIKKDKIKNWTGVVEAKIGFAKVVKDILEVIFLSQDARERRKNPRNCILTWFYNELKNFHSDKYLSYVPCHQPDSILPKLRRYQKRGITWMLFREGVTGQYQSLDVILHGDLFKGKKVGESEEAVFFCPALGSLTKTLPIFGNVPNGGILSDEMGLGKTLMVLALILLNPRGNLDNERVNVDNNDDEENESPCKKSKMTGRFICFCDDPPTSTGLVHCSHCKNSQHASCVKWTSGPENDGNYVCPHCIARKAPIPVKTTLIVVPSTLLSQWKKELETHIVENTLQIYTYEGVRNKGGKGYIPPTQLAKFNIVLTTYNVLQSELGFTDAPQLHDVSQIHVPYGLRQREGNSKILSKISPLTSILWWRICLDEAQMVEGMHHKISQMARKLSAIHRWGVTGTPINKNYEDLHGLCAFVGPSGALKEWWGVMLNEIRSTTTLPKLFPTLIWRTCKADVQDEIGIPPQTLLSHELVFSGAEKQFYSWGFKKTKEIVWNKIRRLEATGTILQSNEIPSEFLKLLEDIRYKCSHPLLPDYHENDYPICLREDLFNRLTEPQAKECRKAYNNMLRTLGALRCIGFSNIRPELRARHHGIHNIYSRWAEECDKFKQIEQDAFPLHRTFEFRNSTKSLHGDTMHYIHRVGSNDLVMNGFRNLSLEETSFVTHVKDISVAAKQITFALDEICYSRNLQENEYGNCARCWKSFRENGWAIFSCGHSFCTLCINDEKMEKMCAFCKERETSITDCGRPLDPAIKGSYHSVKMEGVIKTLIDIPCEEKVIIFSNFIRILEIVQWALAESKIRYMCAMTTGHNLVKAVEKFKNEDFRVLLMPLEKGSKGLNLTEATRVFLLEPGFNPSHEIQAIGRVHRIGQTKPTTVHRFYVKDTIEELIFHRRSTQGFLTLGQLKELIKDD